MTHDGARMNKYTGVPIKASSEGIVLNDETRAAVPRYSVLRDVFSSACWTLTENRSIFGGHGTVYLIAWSVGEMYE